MTLAYFDGFNGASGDMIVGALLAAGADLEVLRRDLAVLELPGIELKMRRLQRQGITATKFDVVVRGETEGPAPLVELHVHEHEHHHPHEDGGGHAHHHHEDGEGEGHDHAHRTLAEVEAVLSRLPEPARGQAIAVFRRLAEAEGKVHGTLATSVHFHEVGMDDAIIDVSAAVLCLRQLGITEVQCSPLPTGSGLVRCAHGLMPVPVPAVVELLRGVPTYDNGERGELVTPTGAALLATLATRFGPPPPMTIAGVGYGAGAREGQRIPNLLRVLLGQSAAQPAGEALIELAANIDDMNPQLYGPLFDKLLAAGALDVTLTPTMMKKGRPGIVLAALAPGELLDALSELLFRETTTLGVRYQPVYRKVLAREHKQVATPWGPIGIKVGSLDGEQVNLAPELDDCRKVAERAGVPLKDVWQEALAAARRDFAGEHSGQS